MHPKCLVTEPKQPQKLRRNSKQTQKPPKKEDKKKKLAPEHPNWNKRVNTHPALRRANKIIRPTLPYSDELGAPTWCPRRPSHPQQDETMKKQ